MKVVTKPSEPEEFVIYSDISGKLLGTEPAPVEIIVNFNCKIKKRLELHMTVDEFENLNLTSALGCKQLA